MNPEDVDQSSKPAAYDPEGRPLYYHPPATEVPEVMVEGEKAVPKKVRSHITTRPEKIDGHNFNPQIRSQYANEPDTIHAHRPMEPEKLELSEELMARYRASKERYPFLNLSEGEFVILDIKRHPIGMLIPIFVTGVLLLAIFTFGALYPTMYEQAAGAIMPSPAAMFGIIILISALVVLGGAVALWVYLQNQFFMTNESVVQEVQESLFMRREQTVSLGSIEDASFKQNGILQTVFDYGTIRLSTEGQETTYVFRYVTHPKRQIAILNNAIESFKNGRPVDPHDN